jgi:tetratricopeptide (TPR) repeat protein
MHMCTDEVYLGLIQTATAEHRAATYAESRRPESPANGATGDLPSFIPPLLSSINSDTYSSDVYEAQACLAWIHWLLGEPGLAISRAPMDNPPSTEIGGRSETSLSEWTKICGVRSAYIKAASLEATGQQEDSLRNVQATLSMVKYHAGQIETSPQLAYWSEQLLAQMAVTAAKTAHTPSSVKATLEVFRTWASTVTKSKEIPAGKYGNNGAHSDRLSIWRAYYQLVSANLDQGVTEATDHSGATRMKQAAELRRVEAHYETELLRITRFPKATESNVDIEEWVEQVIQNWSILCGPDWHDRELGAGGRDGVGRNVLDILYRAASRTFHSTLILRRLFQVHKSLTDFALAYRALDTYIELVERARARAAKHDNDTDGQDEQYDQEIAFRTISEGIEGLCSFGRKSEAKKAYELATKLEDWSKNLSIESSTEPLMNGYTNGALDVLTTKKTHLSRETLGLTGRAMGIAEAHWAKWSPFSEDRTALQAKAVSNLARAINLLQGNAQYHTEAAYALAVLFAETREVDQAIECVKNTLDSNMTEDESDPGYAQERRNLPLWHLLALLLTARQDFDTAAQSCNAAFEQFGSATVLLGSGPSAITSMRSITEKGIPDDLSRGVVDDMECAELQRIVEIRITELALAEVIDGPEDAVNSSNELLALYFRLFGHLDVGTAELSAQKQLAPPKSSSSTIKSFRGSIFGRKKQSALRENFSEKANSFKPIPEGRSTRPTTQATEAPTIKVTDQDEKDASPRSRRFRWSEEHSHRAKHTPQKLVRREGSINQAIRRRSQERHERKSLTSSHRQSFETSQEEAAFQDGPHQPHSTLGSESAALEPQHSIDEVPAPPTSLNHNSSTQAKQALPAVNHNLASYGRAPLPHGHEQQPPQQDVRLPNVRSTATSTSPVPHYPKSAAQKHALTVLVKIWLVIAKLYRRASLFDDSREACDEAAKAAQKIESLVATVESSARAFADGGWGGGTSSDEVWANVFCERAELALAVATVRDADATDETGAGDVREAVEQFEQCLMYYPNHARGIVGLSTVLLDFFEKKVELGRRVDDGRPKQVAKIGKRLSTPRVISQNGSIGSSGSDTSQHGTSGSEGDELRKTPENLNRLAARDRAYGLLSTLTKLGTGWDDSEAWFALARAHELGGEIDKAKEILWWCVELEDTRPIRHWRNVACGGYVL